MTDSNLSQTEADALLAMEKHRTDTTEWEYLDLGGGVVVSLVSTNRSEGCFPDLRLGGSISTRVLPEPCAACRDPYVARFQRCASSHPLRRRNWITPSPSLSRRVWRQEGVSGFSRPLLESPRSVAYDRRLHAVLQRRRTTQYPTGAVYMIQDIQALQDGYWIWLRDKTNLREIRDSVEITTPYLDRHNDYLQIYAKRVNGGFVLTIARQFGFGVKTKGMALEVEASVDIILLCGNTTLYRRCLLSTTFSIWHPPRS